MILPAVVAIALVGVTAIIFYRLGRRHAARPPSLSQVAGLLRKRPDGLPEAGTYPPGHVSECLRCRVPTECGVMSTIGNPFTGHLVNGPVCGDCYRLQWENPSEFWNLMGKRIREEFGADEA